MREYIKEERREGEIIYIRERGERERGERRNYCIELCNDSQITHMYNDIE